MSTSHTGERDDRQRERSGGKYVIPSGVTGLSFCGFFLLPTSAENVHW